LPDLRRAGVPLIDATNLHVAICEALGAVDASMLATVAPKHLLSRSDAYARPPALAPARGPASILRGVAWRNPAQPRSSPRARLVDAAVVRAVVIESDDPTNMFLA